MIDYDVNAYAPQFQGAVRDILSGPRYIRQSDMDLKKTEDIAPWTPDNYLLKLVPEAKDIAIELIDERTDLTLILQDFKKTVNIGLVLIGDQIGPRKRPAIIVMTTSECLYALDPDFDEGINFLRDCLREESLKFWTTNGLQEACCLLKHFNISLKGSNAKDCLGMHLHMMKILSRVRDRYPDIAFYPIRAIDHSRFQRQKLESFEKLLYIWLDLDSNRELMCDPSQYRHLSLRPLNLTAKNIIRKRCSLVLKLAEKLANHAASELTIINDNVLHVLTNVIDDAARKKVKKYLSECEKRRIPPKVYFQHLDAICNFDRSNKHHRR